MTQDKQRIIIIVEGGVIQNIEGIPPNVIVEVHDYDDGDIAVGNEPGIRADADGNFYGLGEWEA